MTTLQDVVRSVVESHLPPGKVEEIRIRPDTDHEGDPILAIALILRDAGDALNARKAAGLARHLRARLAEIGETRFPLLSFISEAEAGALKPEAA